MSQEEFLRRLVAKLTEAGIQGGLDREYLRRWAGELGVADRLEEILGE